MWDCKVYKLSRRSTVVCMNSCSTLNTCYFPSGRASAHKQPHPYSFHSGFWLQCVRRNLSFLAEVIAVWYWLCIRENVLVVGAVRHENACTAGLDLCIYSLVSVACKFRFGSEGMIMSCLKDGRILCVCIILDGDESSGNPQTLSLCLTWIPIHSDINRCPK